MTDELIENESNEVKVIRKKSEGKIIKIQRHFVDPITGKKKGGYGFIISPEHMFTKFFFHWTAMIQGEKTFPDLTEGTKVKFIPILMSLDKEGNNRGPRAIQVEVIEKELEVKE